MKKVLLLEFNELTHSLMEEYIAAGHLPNFERFYNQSQIFKTDAMATGEDLNPWIQWVSLHTGLKPKEHNVYRLNDMENFEGDFVWDTLSKQGIKSWICGSMNTKFKDGFNGLFIYDPWATNTPLQPVGKFETYIDFITQSVQGHASGENVPAKNFLLYMLKNGLTVKTVGKAIKQLLKERLAGAGKWGRAMILDRFQFDLFKYNYRKEKPEFSTFFLNSTAHFQHHYWKDTDPKAFGLTNVSVNKEQSNAILDGYKNMDSILADMVNLVDDNTVIMMCTGLSQQPFKGEERNYYHINSIAKFIDKISVKQKVQYMPVMAEQFHLECESEEEANALLEWLASFEMQSNEFFYVGSNKVFSLSIDSNRVNVQCRCAKFVPEGSIILNKNNTTTIPFYDVFHKMKDTKSGVHDPLGMLWVYDKDKTPQIIDNPIELEEIKPMILEYYK